MDNEKIVRELKPDTGVIPETGLKQLFEEFQVKLPPEIEFPYSLKLTKRHTLMIERRGTQLVTDNGLVNQLNWRIHENMVEPVQRING